LSRVASTSQRANRDKVEGWLKSRRSGPSFITAKRNVRNGLMVALSSKADPCRMIA
jgi:hypothetical protein